MADTPPDESAPTFQPTRRAVVHGLASATALAAFAYLGAQPAAAAPLPDQRDAAPAPPRRVPVGLL